MLTGLLVLGVGLPSYADSASAALATQTVSQNLSADQVDSLRAQQNVTLLSAGQIPHVGGPAGSVFDPTNLPSDALVETQRPTGDDYPGPQGFGYAAYNCTDFVAWRLNRDAGLTHGPWKYVSATFTPNGGNGGEWGREGNMPGWVTTTTPTAGDVLIYPKNGLFGTSTTYGHVAYIAKTYIDGSVFTENYGASTGYFTRFIPAAEFQGYLASGQLILKTQQQ